MKVKDIKDLIVMGTKIVVCDYIDVSIRHEIQLSELEIYAEHEIVYLMPTICSTNFDYSQNMAYPVLVIFVKV